MIQRWRQGRSFGAGPPLLLLLVLVQAREPIEAKASTNHSSSLGKKDNFPPLAFALRAGEAATASNENARRRLEQNNGDDDAQGDDDGYSSNNANNNNGRCSKYLFSFLEGTTDADDTCDGLKNAYTAAGCSEDDESYNEANDNDDYFVNFSAHKCCSALQKHYTEYCRSDYVFSNLHLLFAMIVLLMSECAKNVIHRMKYMNFIPEAGICILVGALGGMVANLVPNSNIDDLSFDSDLFMSVLLPPIIFDAALSVSKTQFKRRRTAIACFAILGTLVSTAVTGAVVFYSSQYAEESLPALDSLVFGALISSIDPIAILSILSSLGLTQADTVYILVLGESLLNDGIAVTVFKTLVARFDGKANDGSTSVSEVLGIIADFIINMVGSVAVALMCGILAWVFFYLLKRTLSPAMEVGSVFIWALVPFYVSEALNWSGIVSLVVMGCFMDVYIASPKEYKGGIRPGAAAGFCNATDGFGGYVDMDDRSLANSITPLTGTSRMRLSLEAEKHVRFFAHVTAQLSESAIFAYLGLFLFSQKYDWDPALITIGILSCLASRGIMVMFMSQFILLIYKMRGYSTKATKTETGRSGKDSPASTIDGSTTTEDIYNLQEKELMRDRETKYMSKTAAALRNPKTQSVLWLAGLRGAVSLSLVENIPMYNALTGEGCQYKPLIKGMTSASIIFTTFVLAGASYFLLPILGFGPDLKDDDEAETESSAIELSSRKPQGLEGFQVNTPSKAHRNIKLCASELSAEPLPIF